MVVPYFFWTFLSAGCPLNVRVSANSPSLWPTIWSVMYTGTCCLPLCTAMVSPMNSGKTIERRDHVLIGFLSLLDTALSALATRWWSTNGPFLRERVICYLLLFTARHDHHLGALVVAGAVTLGQVAPRVDRVPAFAGLALAAPVRVVHRVHHHTADGRADAHVALDACLSELAQAVLFIGDFADRGAALDVDLANFTGA